MKEDYPIKMNCGCFIPMAFFALVGVIYTLVTLFK